MVHFRNIIHALKCGTQFRLIYYYVFNLLFGKKIRATNNSTEGCKGFIESKYGEKDWAEPGHHGIDGGRDIFSG